MDKPSVFRVIIRTSLYERWEVTIWPESSKFVMKHILKTCPLNSLHITESIGQ